MKEFTLMTLYWMHLIATVIWIGGITFILFIAIPSSRQVLGAESGRLMGEISKRFTPIANYSIIILIITGIVLTGLTKQLLTIGQIILILKLTLVFVMVSIHFYRGLVLSSKIMRATPETGKAALQKLSINLVKVNFILGLTVLLLSGVISVSRGY